MRAPYSPLTAAALYKKSFWINYRGFAARCEAGLCPAV
jgi:hypothetical protein